MAKKTYKQSSKVQNFYKAIKNTIVKEFDTLPRLVQVVGNSAEYPDSVALPTDLFMFDVIGFARYDKDGKTIGQYAIKVEKLMDIFKSVLADQKNIVTRGITGIDQTCRLEWKYLNGYELNVG